jgi:hypothetical protein
VATRVHIHQNDSNQIGKKKHKYFDYKVKWKISPIYIHYNQKYHNFANFLKLLWMPKISNEKTTYDLDKNAINKNSLSEKKKK